MKFPFALIGVAVIIFVCFLAGLTVTGIHDYLYPHKDTFDLRVTALPATDKLEMEESPRMRMLDTLLFRSRMGDSSGKYMVLYLTEETALMKWQFKYADMPDNEILKYDTKLLQDTETIWQNKINYLKGQAQIYRDSLRYRPELINR